MQTLSVENQQVTKLAKNLETNTNTYLVLGKEKFEVDFRYEILEPLGYGSYGMVVEAIDTKVLQNTKSEDYDEEAKEYEENLVEPVENLVAIKKINRAFEQTSFSLRAYRELKIMRLLNHENILGIQNILLPQNKEEFNDIYVVADLMQTDLAEIIKDPTQQLSNDHIQFFLYQILRGLKYIHSANILHRDLKPRNILVNKNCDLKICDFGLARAIIPELKNSETSMTDYMVTRWYRAPEILASQSQQTAAVDMWSVGCTLAEMILRRPLLRGTSEEDQFSLIVQLLGSPPQSFLDMANQKKLDTILMDDQPKVVGEFGAIFESAAPEIVDLLSKMLAWDPKERISVNEALKHPYLSQLHDPDLEPIREKPLSLFDFEFEMFKLKKKDYKDLIYEEIELYHNHQKVREYKTDKKFYPKGILSQKYGHRLKREYANQQNKI